MKRNAKRFLLRSIVLSISLGFAGVVFWLAVGEIDDLCTLRTDGEGLYVLDDYGSNVRCDLRLKYVHFLASYYAVILFPLSLLVVYAGQFMVRLGRKMIEGALRSADR